MPSGKVVQRDMLPGIGIDTKQDVFETGGEVLPGGRCFELISPNGTTLRLLESRSNRVSETIECASRTYVTPNLHPSLLEVLTLPTGRASYGSMADLYNRIHDLFVEFEFSDFAGKLFAYFVLSTWFSELLPIAPYLVITGPRPEANIVLQLLGCMVRHGLLLGDFTLAMFRYLPFHIQLTLLISQFYPSMYRALAGSTYSQSNLPYKDGMVNLSCAKVVYAGATVPDKLSGEPFLRINLSPCRGKLPVIHDVARQKIALDFQPRLTDYRLKHAMQVRDSDFDVPSFPSNLRILAQAMGSSIVGAPDLQAEIVALLEDQKETVHASRWIDPGCVAIEAALEYCHSHQSPIRVGVGDLADKASVILASRGEATVVKPKEIGNQLRLLGFPLKRDSQGYAIHLNEILRVQVHVLARDYKVAAAEQVVTNCSQCTEILAAGV